MNDPLAYFLTWRTYGTWLPGDPRGSVDDEHNQFEMSLAPGAIAKELEAAAKLLQPTFRLDEQQRHAVQETIVQVCEYRRWSLVAVHVRTTHVHVVVNAPVEPEKVLNPFKSYATRRLRELALIGLATRPWSRGGSKRYVWNDRQLHDVVNYTTNRQGDVLVPAPFVHLTYLH